MFLKATMDAFLSNKASASTRGKVFLRNKKILPDTSN